MISCICGHPVHANIGGCGVCRNSDCKCEKLTPFPTTKEWGQRTVGQFLCPRCGEDKLELVNEGLLFCYKCAWQKRCDTHA